MNNLRNIVAIWFARVILERPKYKIDHQGDPPWDCSGQPRECGCFDVAQYNTLTEFLEEYTGESYASYISGYGLFHYTYEHDLSDLITEFVYTTLKEEPNTQADREEWSDELDECALDNEIALHTECAHWLCSELFLEGKVGAMEALVQEQAESQARQIEHEAQLQAGHVLYDVYISSMFDIKETVCKNIEAWHVIRPILLNMTDIQRKQIALVLKSSNSIHAALLEGRVP